MYFSESYMGSNIEELEEFYYPIDDYEDYDEFQSETFNEIWDNCCILSISSILPLLQKVIISNLVFGITISTFKLPERAFHLMSGCIGLYLTSEIQSNLGIYVLLFYSVGSFMILRCAHCIPVEYKKGIGISLKAAYIGSLILSEYIFMESEIFLQIRGILMVLVMKIFTLLDETGNSRPLDIFQYFGYIFCGGNFLFGPWITYQQYNELQVNPNKKDIYWILGLIRAFILSLICLTISNCWSSYIINNYSNRWFLAYRDALSFRYSHYFVSFLAETSMIAAGFNNSKGLQRISSFSIVSPLDIEFPSSLSVVVTKWNSPMHVFLKKSIYSPLKKYGQLTAIMGTFLVSSFLHGLEVKVSVVLVSLGLFSYMEVRARNALSDLISACIKIKSCKQCNHKYNQNHIISRLISVLFRIGSIIHLAYLGILMDSSTQDVSIYEKWSNLYFISHIIIFFNFMLLL